MVVTAEAHHDQTPPSLSKGDVTVSQDHDRLTVTDWIPLRGDRAGLELCILIDDSLSTSLGPQLEDIRRFINAQPAATSIAVGYLRNGTVLFTQNFTQDHTSAAKTVRLPIGSPGADASPYFSLEDLVKRWPKAAERREIVLISDGIDRYGGPGPQNPYVATAIDKLQQSGIVVFTIYASSAGHFGHSLWGINWGQSFLSEVAEATGGEAYFQGLQTPLSFAPYLDQISQRLNHQYLLGFLPKPEKKSGFERVRLHTEVPNTDLVGQERVYVPAGL
jgi:hypothetical protein